MIRVAVLGAAGRMGQEVSKLLSDYEDIKQVVSIDIQGRTTAKTLQEVDAGRIDGVIDFSHAKTTVSAAKWCAQYRKFFVSGTTGLSKGQEKTLRLAAKRAPILWAPNLSVGVAVLNQALKVFAGLEGFDFQIEELHHRHKKDHPSGTAIRLQKTLCEVVAPQKVPPPVSMRGGGIRGIHGVWAMSEGETLYFEHQALDRSIFAKGAITAAIWLAKQKPGFYTFENLWQKKTRR